MGGSAPGRPDAGQVHDEVSLGHFFAELDTALHDLYVRTSLCWWEKYTGGPGEGLNELERERSEIMLDPAYRALTEAWSGSRVKDPVLARKVKVLSEGIVAAGVGACPEVYTLQNEIMDRIIAFSPVVYGREVSNSERGRILRMEPDRALRREAWMSIAPLSMEVAGRTVELMSHRNSLARQAGYRDYVHLALSLSSLTKEEVLGVIEGLGRASARAFETFLAETADAEGLASVEPWDVAYLVEKSTAVPVEPFPREKIVSSLEEFARSFGADPDELGIKIVYQDIPFGGLCVPIDPPSDVRILANPQAGHNYYVTLFHEYGHGLHAYYAGGNPFILQEEPGVFCEGMAEVWSWFTYYAGWLGDLGLDRARVSEIVRAQKLRMIARHRGVAAEVAWEYGAYADPGRDLTQLHAEMEARYLLATPRPVHRWAGGPFPSGYPIYKQNYILADVIAAATHRTLAENYGEKILGNKEVFEALAATYWRPGAARPWREKLKAFTGRDVEAASVPYARAQA